MCKILASSYAGAITRLFPAMLESHIQGVIIYHARLPPVQE